MSNCSMRHRGVKRLSAYAFIALASLMALPAHSFAQDDTQVVEKVGTPTVEKQVAEVQPDGSFAWGDIADAQVGVEVPYRIIGTLPSTYDEFDTYYYEFHDELDPQLAVEESSIKVTMRGGGVTTDVTSGFEIAVQHGNVLTARVDDLKALAPQATADTTFTLSYTARLDVRLAHPGSVGAANNFAYLVFSSSPNTGEHGRTVEDQAQLVTWALDIRKVTATGERPLAGAVFTLRNAQGAYVQPDAMLSEEPVELKTDDDGVIVLSGLDAGSYILTEVKAPNGYRKIDGPITLDLTSTLVLGGSTLRFQANHGAIRPEVGASEEGTVTVCVLNGALGQPPVGGLAQTGDPAGSAVCLLAVLGGACLVVARAAKRRSGQR